MMRTDREYRTKMTDNGSTVMCVRGGNVGMEDGHWWLGVGSSGNRGKGRRCILIRVISVYR